MIAAAEWLVQEPTDADAALPAWVEFEKSGAIAEKYAGDSAVAVVAAVGPIVVAAAIACAAVDGRAVERAASVAAVAATS